MKKKMLGLSIIIIIIGIIVVAVKGFKVNFEYRAHDVISVTIGKDYNLEDVRSATSDVFQGQEYTVGKAGLYSDEAIINVETASDDQVSELVSKLNEKLSINQTIEISIGTEGFSTDDVKAIVTEVTGKDDIEVSANEDEATYADVKNVPLLTQSEIDAINEKIIEKFAITSTTDTVSSSYVANKYTVGNVSLTDMLKQYIGSFKPFNVGFVVIATLVVLVYFVIRYKALGFGKVIGNTLGYTVLAELLYCAIIAIIRYPVDEFIIMGAVALYLIMVFYLTVVFTNMQSKLKDQNKADAKKTK